ncbi:MAG: hypothetical protein ACYDIC_13535 [Desulfobaccales bacterium]
MMKLLWLLLFLCFSLPQGVFAIDPGQVQGSLQVNGKAIALTQAYAHLHDNAEGLLDRPQELRLLLIDREVPQESLAGIAFLPVEQMAREGKVQGLLLKLDPNDHQRLVVTLLLPPAEPGQTLMTQTMGVIGQRPPLELKISPQRVGGTMEHHDEGQSAIRGMPKLDYALRFSAPLFQELPVTAILKGQAAQNSPQMRVLREKARALEKGDFTALERLSTARAYRLTRAFLAQADLEAKAVAKQAAAEMQELSQRLQRVVVRGDRAVVIFAGKQWQNCVRERGEWKSDD